MNMNSLIIVADASRARLFRTAQTNVVAEPVELIEIDAVAAGAPAAPDPGAASADPPLSGLARRVAERAAQFAHYHFCNPVIVAAPDEVYAAIQTELARELPHVYTRSVIGNVAELPPRQLMHDLQQRGAFTAVHYPHLA